MRTQQAFFSDLSQLKPFVVSGSCIMEDTANFGDARTADVELYVSARSTTVAMMLAEKRLRQKYELHPTLDYFEWNEFTIKPRHI